MRTAILTLVVVGLLAAVWLLWPDASEDESPATAAPTASTTDTTEPEASITTTSSAVSTTSSAASTTTSVPETHVVETVEEAEEILRDHYSRWFAGIYEEDEDLIRSTVVLDSQVEAAVSQFGIMDFSQPPTVEGLSVADIEVLRSDRECLALWSTVSASFREGSSTGVLVFRKVNGEWKFLSSWQVREDLWEADCESQLQ